MESEYRAEYIVTRDEAGYLVATRALFDEMADERIKRNEASPPNLGSFARYTEAREHKNRLKRGQA